MKITQEINLLQKISDLCYLASEEIFENENTKEILNTCDNLTILIDVYLEKIEKQ